MVSRGRTVGSNFYLVEGDGGAEVPVGGTEAVERIRVGVDLTNNHDVKHAEWCRVKRAEEIGSMAVDEATSSERSIAQTEAGKIPVEAKQSQVGTQHE